MHPLKRLFIAAIGPLVACSALASEPVRVVRVLDGDTIEVLTQSRQTLRVRLANIDAPERSQPYGNVARQALAKLIHGQTVNLDRASVDHYGRTIGLIHVTDPECRATPCPAINVSTRLVQQGYAWVYTRYNNDRQLPAIEQAARAGRAGLWKDPAPVAPWSYRRAK